MLQVLLLRLKASVGNISLKININYANQSDLNISYKYFIHRIVLCLSLTPQFVLDMVLEKLMAKNSEYLQTKLNSIIINQNRFVSHTYVYTLHIARWY